MEKSCETMTELEHLNADLRFQESLYAAAKMRNDHQGMKWAAVEMARINLLFLLQKQQVMEEAK